MWLPTQSSWALLGEDDQVICDHEFLVGLGAQEDDTIRINWKLAAITFDSHRQISFSTTNWKPSARHRLLPDIQFWTESSDAQYYLQAITKKHHHYTRCLVLRALTPNAGNDVAPAPVHGMHLQRVGYFCLYALHGKPWESEFREANIVLV